MLFFGSIVLRCDGFLFIFIKYLGQGIGRTKYHTTSHPKTNSSRFLLKKLVKQYRKTNLFIPYYSLSPIPLTEVWNQKGRISDLGDHTEANTMLHKPYLHDDVLAFKRCFKTALKLANHFLFQSRRWLSVK